MHMQHTVISAKEDGGKEQLLSLGKHKRKKRKYLASIVTTVPSIQHISLQYTCIFKVSSAEQGHDSSNLSVQAAGQQPDPANTGLLIVCESKLCDAVA